MKTIAFFNNKGGVGKTSLVYHLAWMFAAKLKVSVLAVDLDPQANLSAVFLEEERLAELWDSASNAPAYLPKTVFNCVRPLITGQGDIGKPELQTVHANLALLPGHLALSGFEDLLSENWPKCLDGRVASFRVLSAFHRLISSAAQSTQAELVLIDVGPNLGAINRAALIAADHVVVPLGADLFSLQGMKNLGPTLKNWRNEWQKRLKEFPSNADFNDLPKADMQPIGYVVMQHSVLNSNPVKAYQNWLDRIPSAYVQDMLGDPTAETAATSVQDDRNCLALLKHYRSLMPMAVAARKPMFMLKSADGVIGSHLEAVRACQQDFEALARAIAGQIKLDLAVG
jgi:chromosome partitioning protein